ncbi:hypothetical protein [Bilophila wadsworthia]|uniref:hypothetical protein n=1 Tax=Bilophila wadsworthia TaxID=35833 RepID=UPI00242B153C|nr:hypothetical protein [Bilophila wadsworthia]
MIITHAFTLCPLYAEAILSYGKDVENRSWRLPEDFIGVPIALHVGKRNPMLAELAIFAKPMLEHLHHITPNDLPHGGIIGWIRFDRPVRRYPSSWAVGELWHWPILEARRIPERIPCDGRLRVWPIPTAINGGKIEVNNG